MYIKTSHLVHEFLLAKTASRATDVSTQALPERLSTVLEQAYSTLATRLEERCPQAAKFWGVEIQDIDDAACCIIDTKVHMCKQAISTIRADENVFLTFGKSDILVVAPVSHSYWSTHFRMLISTDPGIGEYLSIPAVRVLRAHDERDGLLFENADLTLPTEHHHKRPIVVLTLATATTIGRTPFLRSPASYRRTWLEDTVAWLRPEGKPETLTDNASAVEFFLSQSTHFPLLLKAEVRNFEDLERYFVSLRRCPTIGGTSSVLAIRSDAIWKEDESQLTEKPFPFGFLLKIVPGCESFVRKKLFPALKDETNPTEKPILFGLLLKVVPGHESFVRERLFPALKEAGVVSARRQVEVRRRPHYWDLFALVRTTEVTKLLRFVVEALRDGKGAGSRFGIYQAIEKCATVPYWELGDIEQICPVTHKREHRGLEQSDRSEFNRLISIMPGLINGGKRFTPSILHRRFYNLKFDAESLYCHVSQLEDAWWEADLPGSETFRRMRCQLLIPIREAAKISAQELKGETALPGKNPWITLADRESELSMLNACARALRAELHERTEGLQAITNTEPHILLERSGVTDMHHAAAANLMRVYCGTWNFVGSSDEIDKLWQGVVAGSNTSVDWYVTPEIQMLLLPLQFQLHTHRRLLPLAHEAGHQILFEASVHGARIGNKKAISRWWDNFARAAENYHKLIWPGKPEIPFAAWKHAAQEVLADVIALLSGGPAYALSLFELLFNADPRTNPEGGWFRPLALCRILKVLGLDVKRDPWLSIGKPLEERIRECLDRKIAPIIELDWILTDLPELDRDQIESFFDRNYTIEYEFLPLLPPALFLWAILPTKRDVKDSSRTWLSDFVHFCDEYTGDAFFFYEVDEETGKVVSDGVERVNRRCHNVARRLLADELILDEDLKIIAAASMLPSLKRPTHPSCRVVQSLFYSSKDNSIEDRREGGHNF